MKQIFELFPNTEPRKYKGGFEIRTKNLDWALEKVKQTIETNKLNIEIFEVDKRVNSLSIREVK